MYCQRDVDRWAAGREHWNAWARGLLANKVVRERAGNWAELANVDFSEYAFDEKADFKGFIFPHDARFYRTVFVKGADFCGATFSGRAGFDRTEFRDDVLFILAKFLGEASFINAHFVRGAGLTKVRFEGASNFSAVKSEGPFLLTESEFLQVPDFFRASFLAGLRLEDIAVPKPDIFLFTGEKKIAAHYRALKKIAIESHDHKRELEFFAGELIERRGNDDPKFSAAYVFGFIYELLADFGRSLMRPFYWWLGSLAAFSFLYSFIASQTFSLYRDVSSGFWGCLGKGLYLSFLNSLPVIGFSVGDRREGVLKYLFGEPNAMSLWMDVLFILQNLWSAILIFLFLLSLRNHFKIK